MKAYLMERVLSSVLSKLGYPNPPIDSVPPYRMPGASRWKRTPSGRFSLIEKEKSSTPSSTTTKR